MKEDLRNRALTTKNADITIEDLKDQGYWFERLSKLNATTKEKEDSYISFNTKFWNIVEAKGGSLSIANDKGKSYILVGEDFPNKSRRSFFRNMAMLLDETSETSNYYRLLTTDDSDIFEVERMEPKDLSTRGEGNIEALARARAERMAENDLANNSSVVGETSEAAL